MANEQNLRRIMQKGMETYSFMDVVWMYRLVLCHQFGPQKDKLVEAPSATSRPKRQNNSQKRENKIIKRTLLAQLVSEESCIMIMLHPYPQNHSGTVWSEVKLPPFGFVILARLPPAFCCPAQMLCLPHLHHLHHGG